MSAKKLIVQVKVMRDAAKEVHVDTSNPQQFRRGGQEEDLGTSQKLGSGLAFVEMTTPEAALFAVRYLNNMHLTNRGLIVDFCLQDARKLHARTQKLEKHQRLAMEKKQEEKKKRREAKKNLKNQAQTAVLNLGKRSK